MTNRYTVETTHRERTVVLRVDGRLDHQNIGPFMQDVQAMVEGHPRLAVVSLRSVQFVSSIAWGVLVSAMSSIRARGGRMVLCELTPSVLGSYELLSIRSLLPAYASEDDAVQAAKR